MEKKIAAAFLSAAFIGVFLFIPLANSQQADDTTLQKLFNKIDNLEKENETLKNELQGLKSEVAQIKNAQVAVTPAAAATAATPEKKVFSTKSDSLVQMYGYVKADAIFGDHQVSDLQQNAIPLKDEHQYTFSARESRIGFNLTGLDVGEQGKLVGKLEADFFGDTNDGAISTAVTSPSFRLRQAYVDLKYPRWDILAGQAWDFFAPYNPSTLNFAVLWRAGNLGDRHPQVRWTVNEDNFLNSKTKISQAIGLIDPKISGATGDQASSGAPVLASYTSIEKDIFGKPATLGLGGLYGISDASTTNTDNVKIWAGILAAKIKLSRAISLLGEGFVGADLAAFRGGSPIGVVHNKSVRSRGGWAQLSLTPFTKAPLDKFEFNLGAGADDVFTDLAAVDPATVSTGTTALWKSNLSYFFNIKYNLTKNLLFGLEFQHFDTRYRFQDSAKLNRFQTSVIYNF